MVKKAATATGTTKKASSGASHPSYKEMIKDAILNLKERNGSSRQALKKYIQSNNQINLATQNAFDAQFNKAIKAGVDKGEFFQPKGPSGTVKLAKKEPAPKVAKPAAKKVTTTKATATKKAAPKKPAAKATTTKKAAAPKKTAAAKPKANTAKPRKAATSAPAVVEVPKVLGKTKSGRVTKTTAKPAAATKKAPARKSAAGKKASEKKATPKKSEA